MAAARRSAGSALRRLLLETEGAAAGSGPSTSYSTLGGPQLWRSAGRAGRAGGGPLRVGDAWLQHHARIRGTPLLRSETADFLRQWRAGLKTVAVGSTVNVYNNSGGLLTALLPPALLWLWMMLPSGYRSLAFRLWGLGPSRPHDAHAASPDASDASTSTPSTAADAPSLLLRLIRLPYVVWHAVLDEVLLAARAAYLVCLFLPAILTAPLLWVVGEGPGRERWLRLVQWTLEHAGPAFIKWGQWASTRADLFPEDLCLHLEQLQTAAPAHGAGFTVAAVERAFGAPLGELFESFDERPLASGSIAQIHVATLSARGAELVGAGAEPGTRVAVKVRHPHVSQLMARDFTLMQRAAALAARLPALRELRLEESIRQFGGPLREQLDLAVEAEHLARFNANFRAWGNVRFPIPLFPLVSPDVLVESFEAGDLITRYVRAPHRHNAALAQTGVDVFLHMLLRDNFIHADLHPGNILVSAPDPPAPWAAALAAWLPARGRSWLLDRVPAVVLLDTGMIVELSAEDTASLAAFFRCLTRMDGRGLADAIVSMSVDGTCKDAASFGGELEGLFAGMDREHLRRESQAVMRGIIDHMRAHAVTLRSSVSTVVVTSMVLEGWSSRLDPDVRIMDTLRDMLHTGWADRVGRAVDRLMASGAVAEP